MTLKFFKMLNYKLFNEILVCRTGLQGDGEGVDTPPPYFVHQGIF